MRLIFNLLIACFLLVVDAEESTISDIVQLTSPSLGFKKAGEAYFSPDGQMVIFQGVPLDEEDYQIYTLDLKTRKFARVSQGDGACTCSFFSPDGKKIIFAASPNKASTSATGTYKWDLTPYMNIYEANIDGTEITALTHGPAYHAECAYSPDGAHIVYASNEDGNMNIYTMASDGTCVKQLTHTDYCYNGGPFFSPDGGRIVFRADRGAAHFLQLYLMDIDGENLIQLTDDNAVNWAPYWHPSGKAIVYTTSLHGHQNYQIYFFNIETRKQYQVTDYPGFNGLPTFDRTGTQMLFTSKRGMDKTSQIFMANFHLPKEWLLNQDVIPNEDL